MVTLTSSWTTAKGEHDFKPKGPDDILEDPHRINFFKGCLTEIATASQEGVIIKSYFGWTSTDNWEWVAGLTDRFGVTWVDFASPDKTRYAKRSAYFLREFFGHLIKY